MDRSLAPAGAANLGPCPAVPRTNPCAERAPQVSVTALSVRRDLGVLLSRGAGWTLLIVAWRGHHDPEGA